MFAYGPVPSRRLGNSIGVSPIPAKVCSYSCVYCQLGRTDRLLARREQFFPRESILRDIRKVFHGAKADVITFVGDGEPTLCADLGWLIDKSKNEFGLPVAVITNGSLLFQKDVQEDLSRADILLPTLDAADEQTFRRINRPHGSIRFDQMLDGMLDFRKEFAGKFWMELMLVKGVNDTDRELTSIREIVGELKPDRVFVMTPIRPPAEQWVECPATETVARAERMLSDAMAVADLEEGDFGLAEYSSASEAILEISARHPLRWGQARAIEESFGEHGTLEKLCEGHDLEIQQYRDNRYIVPTQKIKHLSSKIGGT